MLLKIIQYSSWKIKWLMHWKITILLSFAHTFFITKLWFSPTEQKRNNYIYLIFLITNLILIYLVYCFDVWQALIFDILSVKYKSTCIRKLKKGNFEIKFLNHIVKNKWAIVRYKVTTAFLHTVAKTNLRNQAPTKPSITAVCLSCVLYLKSYIYVY